MTSDQRTISCVRSSVRYNEPNISRLRDLFGPARFLHLPPTDDPGLRAARAETDVAVLAAHLDERFLKAPKHRCVRCDHSGLNGSVTPEVLASELIVTGWRAGAGFDAELWTLPDLDAAFPASGQLEASTCRASRR